MTEPEFTEIRMWIINRWPQTERLKAGQWAAYYEELGGFDAADVRSGLKDYFGGENPHPPSVNKLVVAAREHQQLRRTTVIPALPAPPPSTDLVEAYRRMGRQQVWRDGSFVEVTVDGRSPVEVFKATLPGLS